MFGELAPAAELDPVGHCTLPAFIGPRQDQMPLKLSQAAKHRNHQLAVGRCSVGPRIAQRSEPSTSSADGVQRIEEVPGATHQPTAPELRDALARATSARLPLRLQRGLRA